MTGHVPSGDSPQTSRWIPILGWLLFLAIAVYGSWIPLRPTHLPWSAAVAQFDDILRRPLKLSSRSDFVTNIVLFVPLGLLGLAALTGPRATLLHRLLLLPVACAVCAGLSFVIEFGQLFIETRSCSKSDLVAQAIGALLGSSGWLFTGPLLNRWLAKLHPENRPRARLTALLELYLLALWIYLLLPFDVTVRPAELYHKFLLGRMHAWPLADVPWTTESLLKLAGTVQVFLPVGVLVAIRGLPPGKVRSLGWTFCLAVGLAAFAEFCQLFIYSRFATATDVLAGTCGILAGAAAARAYAHAGSAVAHVENSTWRAWQTGLALTTIFYGFYLAAALCLPCELLTDPQLLSERAWSLFTTPPLTIFYAGLAENAISEILRKLLLFGPFGVMLALCVLSLGPSRRQRRLMFGGACLLSLSLALAIELAQVCLLPHIPDLTDVILYVGGTLVGLLAVDWLCREQDCRANLPNFNVQRGVLRAVTSDV